jgi:DNA-directed RNA polymerase specialized sigma24 family protein
MLSELQDELGRLAPEHRSCYLLFYVEGYTYKEIMKLTGYSYEQVKTYIQTARRHVERKFQ